MLYERWHAISSERRKDLALQEFASGRRWTFGELFNAGATRPMVGGPFVHARGQTAEFILDILAAWRENKTACPLETGQNPPAFPPPANCLHLKSTSATGGAPRWVAFTAEQLAADADNIVCTMSLRPDWPNLGMISMAHSYGFSNLVLPLLLHGIPLILAPAPLPEIIRRASQNGAPLTIAAVPATWRAWHEADATSQNVRLAISAGAPLPLNLEQSVFARLGLKIHNFLGSSECGGIAYDAQKTPRTDGAFVGTALRNVNLSLNTEGCLTVSSRAVAEAYWPEPSQTLGNGVFQTSDLAEFSEGKVFLLGRLGDQINVAGRKISPERIERTLLTHPGVRECIVFGAPSRNAERSETIVAMVASDQPESELKHFLLERLPAWQVPRDWQLVDSLPSNGRGKLSRSECRRRWLAASAK
jgi:long-chain acyl-CoA synthetase